MKKLINEEKKIFKKFGKNNNLNENNSSDLIYNDSMKKTGNNNYNYENNSDDGDSDNLSLRIKRIKASGEIKKVKIDHHSVKAK